MAIVNAQLQITYTDLLVVPANKSYAITNILVCNTSVSTAASFKMYLVPDGDSVSDNVNMVVNSLELPPGETFTFDSERIVLEAGDKIVFDAAPDSGSGATTLAATVSYLEV